MTELKDTRMLTLLVLQMVSIIWSSANGRFEPGSAGGYVAGTDLDLAGANAQDAGYVSHRSPDSTVTKTLTVTVASKTSEHYEFGSGSANGYVIDGDQSPHLTLSKGVYNLINLIIQTYTPIKILFR